ncbi:CatB-related O-acetyltransferase [Pectobacterium brasiliense]|uniref:CatB-related O-acetyltransferase n=1 Tax=Pectobacterium brasiliense TaxID=180957 RepID=UPI001D0D52FC|nr:CatB-related O-acetyltransferase [Pectobacterium brasiliense]MDY4332808.1 CatB-related O-acetyltransferase [Pectobacterium brasiliense]UDQ74495.1 CatB-related O-acetyltransferase [Pectobacterium brasiliense]
MLNVLGRPYCTFSRSNGDFKRFFKLEVDGRIKDLNNDGNDNERFWSFDSGILYLLSKNKDITSSFYLKESNELHSIFEGFFMDKIPLKIVCVKNRSDLYELKTKYQNSELIERGYLKVGDHTYGYVSFVDKSYGKLTIGDYCSIAHSVEFIAANHRIDSVSTYPFKSLRTYWYDGDIETYDHVNKGNIRVGNDVWIGRSAKIMSGVNVGDGAVIAAGAIVTKNVDSYSVVAGNPAKHIKYRIEDEEDRRKMLDIAWWNWSEEKVSENINKIMTLDIKAFISEFYNKDEA